MRLCVSRDCVYDRVRGVGGCSVYVCVCVCACVCVCVCVVHDYMTAQPTPDFFVPPSSGFFAPLSGFFAFSFSSCVSRPLTRWRSLQPSSQVKSSQVKSSQVRCGVVRREFAKFARGYSDSTGSKESPLISSKSATSFE